ncbi:MAG: Gfo/Idh/MocA family oxidoreductase, partial [Armatimonadetes bacterium]|nr:Gfo/Idh/MocA family oxidoreductase [Armatimonadota bacterium]
EVLLSLPEVEVGGIADLNGEVVTELGRRHGIALATTEVDRLVEDPSLPVIAIAAGDKAHYPLVMACARAGKHVICEKPIATEVSHGREMVTAMATAERLFSITFNNRAGRVTRRIKELVDSGVIGKVRMVRLVGLMAQPDNRDLRAQIGEEASRARLRNICVDGKNALFDCGVHSFDFARYLVGSEFKRLEAMGYGMRGLPHPDHGVKLCEHENGVLSLIEKSFVYAYEAAERKEYVRYDVEGDEGSLSWDLDTQVLRVHGRTTTLREQVGHEGKYEVRGALYQGFLRSVAAGRLEPWLASGEDGLKAIEAAQAALDAMLARGMVQRDAGPARNWYEATPAEGAERG